ncbi:MAG: RIP metalloprotease RseP [Bdellovibrionaceae bacterium]|nr:RIP metalloprotease RseP [Bdellovibrionales bacterium]MCB9254664.1 RIP metalloprotease RseP [Pseudobdellovibrionaceae bacterium]
MITAAVGVIVLLGGLIFFHELGHFLVAKSFGVRVEVFSLGFGKKLFKKQWGETEYALSLFPLGGYVKLMGDDPYKEVPAAEAHRAFSTQKLYKRFLIVAAGPLANLLLAYMLFTIVFWAGQPTAAAQLGQVKVNSVSWDAGLRPKDVVTAIANTPILTWKEIESRLDGHAGETLEVTVKRSGTELKIPVPVSRVKSRNEYGEEVMVAGFDGISLLPLASKIGVAEGSAAYQAGLRTGDLVGRIENENVALYEDIDEVLEKIWEPGKAVTIAYRRPASFESQEDPSTLPEKTATLNLPKIKTETLGSWGRPETLGIFPSEVFVAKIHPDSPAEAGGMQAGDRILKVGDKPVYHFDNIVDYVQEQGKAGAQALLTIQRNGKIEELKLTPKETTREDPLTRSPVTQFLVGFSPMTAFYEPASTEIQIRSFGPLIARSVGEVNELAERMLVSLGKLVMGKISVKNLGGPVLIASVAGKSLHAGIIPFLQMMALISINLFLLNLFPIPILDGGHLLFFTIEAVQRKPVSIRTMEIANQMGMVFILLLVGLTLFNDISRMILH